MSEQKAPTYKKSYPWAINPIKLSEAIKDLEEMKAGDPTFIIDEAAIKYRYTVRKGVVLKSPEDIENEKKAARAKKIADAKALIAEEEAAAEKDSIEEEEKVAKKSKKAKEE